MKIRRKVRKKDTFIYVGFSRNGLKAAIVVLLFTAGALKLASESMTMTTYYPSPTGIYRLLTSTQRTILARDGGNVGVGTITPAAKLDVRGDVSAEGAVAVGQLATDPPNGRDGMIYYNTAMKSFRGFQNGKWSNIIGQTPSGTVCGMRHACLQWGSWWGGGAPTPAYDTNCSSYLFWWWWWYIEYYYPELKLSRYSTSVACEGTELTMSVDESIPALVVQGCPEGYSGATTPTEDVFGRLWWWWWWYYPSSSHQIYCVKT